MSNSVIPFPTSKSFSFLHRIDEACIDFLKNLFDDEAVTKSYISMPAIISEAELLTTSQSDDPNANNMRYSMKLRVSNPKPFVWNLQTIVHVYQMLLLSQKSTKRDLYYRGKHVYQSQANFNRSLTNVCRFLHCSRENLKVVSCSRGFLVGDLQLYNNDEERIDFRQNVFSVFENYTDYKYQKSTAKLVLIVEKDSVFQRLVEEDFTRKFPEVLLITGRGYPDFCTRGFLKWLSERIPALSFVALTDADPYGIEIYLTYKYGSKNPSCESGNPCVPTVELLGLCASEADDLPINSNAYLPLSAMDVKKCSTLLKRLETIDRDDSDLLHELNCLLRMNCKLELEAITDITANYLTSNYLRRKLGPYLNEKRCNKNCG